MNLLDMMIEQAFNERMAEAQAQGALVAMAREAGEGGDYDTALLAWLLTGQSDAEDQNDKGTTRSIE